jgi:hypothetical protein
LLVAEVEVVARMMQGEVVLVDINTMVRSA